MAIMFKVVYFVALGLLLEPTFAAALPQPMAVFLASRSFKTKEDSGLTETQGTPAAIAEIPLTNQNKKDATLQTIAKQVFGEATNVKHSDETSHREVAEELKNQPTSDAVVPNHSNMAEGDKQSLNLSLKRAIFHDVEHDWNELINELVELLF